MTTQRLTLFLIFCCSPFVVQAAKFPSKSQRTPPLIFHEDNGRAHQHPEKDGNLNYESLRVANAVTQQQQGGNAFLPTRGSSPASYQRVVYVAAINILLNTLRQDPFITWQMRIPRVMWELTILFVANASSTTGMSTMPGLHIFLASLLASTAVVDLFIWAPLFASFASFDRCQGGIFRPRVCKRDYSVGVGKLVVVIQCMTTGLLYLLSSIDAIGTFTFLRDRQKVDRHVRAMKQWEEVQQQIVHLRKSE